MPTTAELIDAQYCFEEERGLLEFNIPPHSFFRLFEELEEVIEAYSRSNDLDVLRELIDCLIFIHSIFGQYARKLGISPERVDQMIEEKMAINQIKYDTRYFRAGKPTKQALQEAKRAWNGEEWEGNDYY